MLHSATWHGLAEVASEVATRLIQSCLAWSRKPPCRSADFDIKQVQFQPSVDTTWPSHCKLDSYGYCPIGFPG